MGAGVPIPKLLCRTRSLIAALAIAACWLAAPVPAAALVPDGQTPAAPPAAVPAQLPAPTAEVAAAGAAVSATATEASASVQRVVTGAGPTVAGAGTSAQPTVEAALPAVTPSIPPTAEPTGGAAHRRSPGRAARAAGEGSSRPAPRQERRADARRRSDTPSTEPRREALPAGPVAATETAHVSRDIASPAGSIQAAPERAPLLDPLSGAVGGPSASGASASLLFGGLAVLLTALCLAGPALRRRLPSRLAMSWPAAFVPLLERPG
jgi:hypothetical protein